MAPFQLLFAAPQTFMAPCLFRSTLFVWVYELFDISWSSCLLPSTYNFFSFSCCFTPKDGPTLMLMILFHFLFQFVTWKEVLEVFSHYWKLGFVVVGFVVVFGLFVFLLLLLFSSLLSLFVLLPPTTLPLSFFFFFLTRWIPPWCVLSCYA